jgi:hypothetical protein
MKWPFNDLKDFRDFSIYVISELESENETIFSKELKGWSNTGFSSPSEFLGELRIILNTILNEHIKLNDELRENIRDAIKAINKAFGQN